MQYQWLAVYGDNKGLAQYPKAGEENKYANIDREKLEKFVVLTKEEKPRVALVVHLNKDSRLIYRQRVEKRIGGGETRVWLVGSQTTKDGKNSQYVSAIFEDGHIELLDGWVENSAWFYSPEAHENEGEKKWESTSSE